MSFPMLCVFVCVSVDMNRRVDVGRENRDKFNVLQAQQGYFQDLTEDDDDEEEDEDKESREGTNDDDDKEEHSHRHSHRHSTKTGSVGVNSRSGSALSGTPGAGALTSGGATSGAGSASSARRVRVFRAMDSWPLEKSNPFGYVSTTVCNKIAAEMDKYYIQGELTLSLHAQVVLLVDIRGSYAREDTTDGFLDSAEVFVKAGSVGVVSGFLPVDEFGAVPTDADHGNSNSNSNSNGSKSRSGHHIGYSGSDVGGARISASAQFGTNVARAKHTNGMFPYVPIVRFYNGVELPVYGVEWVYSSQSWSPTGKMHPQRQGFRVFLDPTASGRASCGLEKRLLPSTTCLRAQLPLKLGYASSINRIPFFGQYLNPDDATVDEPTVLTTAVTQHDCVQLVLPQSRAKSEFNSVYAGMSCVSSLDALWFNRHLTALSLNAMPGSVAFYERLGHRTEQLLKETAAEL
jgi:hypothetical protein